jgi:hypothetical protein
MEQSTQCSVSILQGKAIRKLIRSIDESGQEAIGGNLRGAIAKSYLSYLPF